MRLFINEHFFISVIQDDKLYSCQVMELIHGRGMVNASILDNQQDVIGSIVHGVFSLEKMSTGNLNEVLRFHEKLLIESFTL